MTLHLYTLLLLLSLKIFIFQYVIFGPVIAITVFADEVEALAIANDTQFGLGAGVWTRDMNRAYRMYGVWHSSGSCCVDELSSLPHSCRIQWL